MRRLHPSRSILMYLDELDFTYAALSAHEATSALAAPFGAEIEAWNSLFTQVRASRRKVVAAEARVAIADENLDRTTMRFAQVLLVETEGDRKSPLFRRFFPSAPSEHIRGNLRKQCERTRDVMIAELEKLEDTSPLKPFKPQLLAAANAALEAIEARGKAKAEATQTSIDLEEWKEGINRLRTTTHAEIRKIAVDRRLGSDFAETFFRVEASSSANEPLGDEPAPADPPPTP
ncbi:MAG: hypothetical protein HYV07_32695 [Deltaproteobacteria bacterium]|nr:hypothetical protein [Deltaproteobacteria bacterium]